MSQREKTIIRMLEMGFSGELQESDMTALGFADPKRLEDGLGRLRARVDVARTLDLRLGEVLRALSRTCDPDQAFAGLERWLDAGGAALGASAVDWTDEGFLGSLCQLFAGTPALSEYFIRFPGQTRPVLKPVLDRAVPTGRKLREKILAAVRAAPAHREQMSVLRRSRLEATLQIAALDLEGITSLESTTQALSDLADACQDAALVMAVERLKPQWGEVDAYTNPDFPEKNMPPFAILSLGKLGGRELNYSSDIDLIFVYAGEGKTKGLTRSVSYSEYFQRVGEEVIAALDKITDDGQCFRVDMRLRPHGSVGPLVMEVSQVLAYLQSEGRTWERQAWLKARTSAGAIPIGKKLLKEASTFIYRRFLSIDAISDIKALKRQMEHQIERKGQSEDEVKLGRGGIRDVEFTVQFLQLLHGGGNRRIRGGHTLDALYKLRTEGLLTERETVPLERAYVFLRFVEHRLQLHANTQTHLLPADLRVRRRVALSMGFSDEAAKDGQEARSAESHFEEVRQQHVNGVRGIFEEHFAKLFPGEAYAEAELSELLLTPEPDVEAIAKLLPHFGFKPLPATAKALVKLRRERLVLANPSRTRKFLASLAPLLLRALAATGEPEGALRRFSRIAGSLGGNAILYQALHAHPWLMKMVSELAAWSEYLTEFLVANPGLFDDLIDALRTNRSKQVEEMEAELKTLTEGGEVSATLRAYRAGEMLRIGVRNLIHSVPLEQTQAELSDLATVLLRSQLNYTLRVFQEKRGIPHDEKGRPVGFAILSVGKFGGRELNIGSDLDLLYFYERDGQTEAGLPAGNYYIELAQHLTRSMQELTAQGRLYQLDARLRPNGSKGPLASSLDAFKQYWKDGSLADWERLALTRVRMVAGDPGVGERVEHLIRSAVYSPLQSSDLAEKVRDMRKKIEDHSESGDVKTGRGGIVDIEFLVQYLLLVHGPTFPPLRKTNTRSALKALSKSKKLNDEDGAVLLEAYEFFNTMANRVRIVHGLSANTLPSKEDELQKLALRAQYIDSPEHSAGQQLLEEYQRLSQAVRGIFEKLVV